MHRALTHRESSRHAWPARGLIAVSALSALLLAGCGSSGGTSTEGTVSSDTPAPDRAGGSSTPDGSRSSGAKGNAPGAPSSGGASAGPADVARSGAPVVGVGPRLTRSASLDLQVKDVAAGAARVRGIAVVLQAQVLSEQIGKGGPGDPTPLQEGDKTSGAPGSGGVNGVNGDASDSGGSGGSGGFGTLTLSVPADRLDTALDQLSRIGTVLRRTTSSQDVTAQYVDTESRLKTMRASVARVRALMAQAKDIGQVVALESELSRRQADLESLESQLGALKTSVERSTVAVSLSTPVNEPDTTNGFLAGLRSGWDAFTSSASGLLTAVGAALPFAAFFALIGAAVVWGLRRRRASRPAAGPAPAGPATP